MKSQGQDRKGPKGREDRLKAALKANIQRRKAQAKARVASSGRDETESRKDD